MQCHQGENAAEAREPTKYTQMCIVIVGLGHNARVKKLVGIAWSTKHAIHTSAMHGCETKSVNDFKRTLKSTTSSIHLLLPNSVVPLRVEFFARRSSILKLEPTFATSPQRGSGSNTIALAFRRHVKPMSAADRLGCWNETILICPWDQNQVHRPACIAWHSARSTPVPRVAWIASRDSVLKVSLKS